MANLQIAVAGAAGRTGRVVLELASRDDSFTIAAALTHPDDPQCSSTLHVGDEQVAIVEKLGTSCDVLIDFSTAAGTMDWLKVCERLEIPMVIGATGHDDKQLAQIRQSARIIPIVKEANFSVGIQAMLRMAGRLADELGADFDIEIVETHHRHKVDAPSGTALTILDEILQATNRNRKDHVVFGRTGDTGQRHRGQIGVHALRMGEHVGTHEVHFSGRGEHLLLHHRVESRETFADGALRAASWIVDQTPGLYTLRDVME